MAELADVKIKDKEGKVIWRIFADEQENIVFEHVPSGKIGFWISKEGAIRKGNPPSCDDKQPAQ